MDVLAEKPNLLRLITIRHLTREPVFKPVQQIFNISRVREFYLEFNEPYIPPKTFSVKTIGKKELILQNCQYNKDEFPLYVKLMILPKFREKILNNTNMRRRLLNTITIIEDNSYLMYWVFGNTYREDGPSIVWKK